MNAAEESGNPDHQAVNGCDILIADDTGQAREVLAGLLRGISPALTIQQVRDGTEALAAWAKHKPRLAFLDIDMPGPSGLEVLKTLRQDQPHAFIVMISGYSSVNNVRESLGAGASGFIVKPYKPQRIVEVLDRYFKQTGHNLAGARSLSA
jgi:two-component system chemotaxis response regulator CheY